MKLCPKISSQNYKPNQAEYFPWTWFKPKCYLKTTQSANEISYNMNSHFCNSYKIITIGIINLPYLLMSWHSTICKLQEWVFININIKMLKLWQKIGSTCSMTSLPKKFQICLFLLTHSCFIGADVLPNQHCMPNIWIYYKKSPINFKLNLKLINLNFFV